MKQRCLQVVSWLGFLCVSLPSPAFAQSEEAAVKSFKKIVKSVDDFFSTSPVVLHSEDLTRSPSGKINCLLRFEKIQVSFDVTKTNSLISPYTAYIALSLMATSNRSSGDIKPVVASLGPTPVGFQNTEDALKARDFASCAYSWQDSKEWCLGDTRLVYAYQDGGWVFKSADQPDSSRIRDGQTSRILGLQFLDNPDWQKVLTGKK